MTIPDTTPRRISHEQLLLWAAVLAWIAIIAATWPLALSFGDEVGYLGQARLLLQGQIRPGPDSAGLWVAGPHGLMAKYPLFHALLLLPAVAVHPRAVFCVGILATIGLVWVGGRVLRAWGRHPAWALVFLAHPGIAMLSRTAMADLPFALAAVGAWWALTRGRWLVAAVCFACLVASKVPGAVLGSLLLVGWAFGRWHEDRASLAKAFPGLILAGSGLALGGIMTVAFNLLTSGTIWFGYDHATLGVPVFGLRHLATSGLTHLISALLCPPLLIAGAWPFWKRKEFGPLFAIFGFGALMAVYYFVDTAPGRMESVVLSQRLILPVVAFLLIGYADLLANLADRIHLGAGFATTALAAVALAVILTVSVHHQRWQQPMARALEDAAGAAAAAGTNELTLTYEASKVGLLYPGPVRGFVPGNSHAAVVFCGRSSASYRRADLTAHCDFPGYRTLRSLNGFDILVPDVAGLDPSVDPRFQELPK